MAIIVREEKSGTGLWTALAWLIIVGIVVIALYYVFFISPQTSEFLVPGFQNTAALSQIQFNPESVISSVPFQSLTQYINLSTSTNPGKTNPFLSF